MPLHLVRSGLIGGLMFLATIAILGRLAREDAPSVAILGPDPDVDGQFFQVLADARKILEGD